MGENLVFRDNEGSRKRAINQVKLNRYNPVMNICQALL